MMSKLTVVLKSAAVSAARSLTSNKEVNCDLWTFLSWSSAVLSLQKVNTTIMFNRDRRLIDFSCYKQEL
jgi:hypothetical protein